MITSATRPSHEAVSDDPNGFLRFLSQRMSNPNYWKQPPQEERSDDESLMSPTFLLTNAHKDAHKHLPLFYPQILSSRSHSSAPSLFIPRKHVIILLLYISLCV